MTVNRHHDDSTGGFSLRSMRVAFTALALVLTPWAAAHSATITVNSLLGAATANGLCELSEALQAAETNLAVDGCAAGTAGADTISFASSLFTSGALPKLIDLGGGYLGNVRESMTLSGPGADRLKITVSGLNNASFTLGQYSTSLTPSFEISGMTFTASSGALCVASNGGLLYVHDVLFDACPSAIDFRSNASPSANTVTVRRTLFKNGSGSALNILGAGTGSPRTQVLIEQSIIRDQFGTSSNPLISIANGFDATFQNVEITSNAMLANALINFGNGIDDNSVNMRNVTIANNTIGSAGIATMYAQLSTIDISNSTIANNTVVGATGTGGLTANRSTATILSTVLANNTFNSGAVASDLLRFDATSVVSADHSLIQNAFATTGTPINGTSTANIAGGTNPLLAGLAANGGYNLFGVDARTLRPLPGSPLIDAGANPVALATDGRGTGFARVVGASADIGAMEADGLSFFAFAQAAVSAIESAGGASLAVLRTGDTSAAVSVRCRPTTGGSATANVDYDGNFDALLTWAANDTAVKYCVLPIFDDALIEGNETLRMELYSPQPTSIAAINSGSVQSTLTIIDDDGAPPAPAGSIVVNSLLGAATVNGLCELSEALQAAETNLAVDGCAAGTAGADTISFASSLFTSGALPKLIDLGGGYLGNVRESMTLSGPGADRLKITVSGLNNASFTLGQYSTSLTPSFEISGMTFTASSGALCVVSNGGLLYVHDVLFDACPSAIDFRSNASPSANTVTVRRTLFKNGSGSALNILGAGTGSPRTQVLIEQSIIRDQFGTSSNPLINIANGFDATFQNVEITSNAMLANALINFGNGIDDNSVTMRNVTIANNATNAVGGFATVLAQRSRFDLSNSTIVNNTAFSDSRGTLGGSTGGLYSIASTLNIVSSVLANNTFNGVSKPGDYYKHDGASIINIDHSLLRSPFGVTNPLLNSDTNNVPAGSNPQLGALAYNGGFGIDGSGGYTVRSVPVLAGSPLIGAGVNPLALVNDMRGGGFPRATANGVTIGAVQEGTPTVFNFATSVASGNEGTGVVLTVNRTGSLAAAATVQCVTGLASDTATSDLDYTPVNATLSWAANDGSAKTCTIPLLTDALVEGPEIVTVRLQNPTPIFDATTQTTAAVGLLSAVTLTINDALPPSLVLLTVSKSGTGSGNVSSSPAGISCGATCSASFAANAVVTLTATAGSGATFTGWTGACSGTAVCVVTLDVARSVSANFDAVLVPPVVSQALPVSTLSGWLLILLSFVVAGALRLLPPVPAKRR